MTKIRDFGRTLAGINHLPSKSTRRPRTPNGQDHSPAKSTRRPRNPVKMKRLIQGVRLAVISFNNVDQPSRSTAYHDYYTQVGGRQSHERCITPLCWTSKQPGSIPIIQGIFEMGFDYVCKCQSEVHVN